MIGEELQHELLSQISIFLQNKGNVEWEFATGRAYGYFGPINRGIFQDTIRRLKALGGFSEVKSEETLDITLHSKRRDEQIPIRATISGRENIVLFCKENESVLESMKLLYKSRDIDGVVTKPVDIKSFGIRSNLKSEIELDLMKDNSNRDAEKARRDYLKKLDRQN